MKRDLALLLRLAALLALALGSGSAAPARAVERPGAGQSPKAMAAQAPAGAPEDATVELHAHLFMKEGMTWAFHGDFDGPIRATSWKDRFWTMANPEALDRSGIGILVATLYAHPLFTLDLRDSIRRQVGQARAFVAAHPGWALARDAREARAALAAGKRVMVLALEGAAGVLETEKDLEEFVDQDGIRIVTLLHLTDDEYGGVAYLRGIRALSTPLAWLGQLFSPLREDGVRINRNGLSSRGREMALALMRHGAWIDLSHASDESQKDLVPLIEKAGLPLLYTHTSLRRYLGAERGITAAQLEAVRRTRGVVGLIPSEEMLLDTPVPAGLCAPGCAPGSCEGGVRALAVQYGELARALGGGEAVDLGSDWNGGLPHLRPTCATGTGLDERGLWNIGQQGEAWRAIAKLGAPVPRPLSRGVGYFLDAWARVSGS